MSHLASQAMDRPKGEKAYVQFIVYINTRNLINEEGYENIVYLYMNQG